nr:glucosaminidase domain-containing protein [Bacteroides sp. AM54-2NS]
MANKNQEYTEQYADYAMAQMRRYGIPASVTLAQGILESSNGQSRLAVNENNHFGIKPRPNGLPKVAGTVCIPMTSRTRSFAATTAWAIRMSTTHAS